MNIAEFVTIRLIKVFVELSFNLVHEIVLLILVKIIINRRIEVIQLIQLI